MTEHSEPRRWKLTGLRLVGKGRDFSGVLPEIDPRLDHDEVVHVREDKATEADVAAVANWLAGFADEVEFNTTEGRDRLSDARSLLSTIFKEGGEES